MTPFPDRRMCFRMTIDDHPLNMEPDAWKKEYLDGIAHVLFSMFKNDSFAWTFFACWTESLTGNQPETLVKVQDNPLKVTLRLRRRGLRFYRYTYPFLFDCYYLAEAIDPRSLNKLHSFFAKRLNSHSREKALEQVNGYFRYGSACNRIPASLAAHRRQNIIFSQKGPKRILVCGNSTSGKSMVINALSGKSVIKTSNVPSRQPCFCLYSKPAEPLSLFNKDGIFSHGVFSAMEFPNSEDFDCIGTTFITTLGQSSIVFIDTCGYNQCYEDDINPVRALIEERNYDLLLYVSNSQYFATNDEKSLLDDIHYLCDKPVVFVLNKIDRFSQRDDSIGKMLGDAKDMLSESGLKDAPVIPFSALAALCLQLGDKFDKEDHELLTRKFSLPYYDLPKYLSGKESGSSLDKTGLTLLAGMIKKLLSI